MSKKAILIGATGLIGTDLLKKLITNPNYNQVLVISRKPINNTDHKLEQLIINFEDLNLHKDTIIGDDVFCCLGTTAKNTPDLTTYKKIDYQYPLDLANIAVQNGAQNYHLISSMGANATSKIFYTRTKGEIEKALQALPFKGLHIYRPSLLDGNRKEVRSGESIMIRLMRIINPILVGSLRKYRSIKIGTITEAMLRQAEKNLTGTHIYLSDEIEKLGN